MIFSKKSFSNKQKCESFYINKKPPAKLCRGKIIAKIGDDIFYKSTNSKWRKISHHEIDEYTIKDSIRHGIAITRDGGRFGNQLFEYAYQRLISKKYGLAFKSTFTQFPKPYDNVETEINAGQPDPKIKFPKSGLKNPEQYYERYPHSVRLYKNHKKFFQKILMNNKIPQRKNADIVVHVRLDDVFNDPHPNYTVLPFSFYEKVFDKIEKSGSLMENVILVSMPIDDFQKDLLKKLKKFLLTKYKGIKKIRLQSKDLTSDMITLMKAPIAVHSVGSFPFWPMFLSDIVKEIHVPIFGQTRSLPIGVMDLDQWRSTKNLKIIKYKLSFDVKIEKDEIDRIFDV